jgi:hypothetical protein
LLPAALSRIGRQHSMRMDRLPSFGDRRRVRRTVTDCSRLLLHPADGTSGRHRANRLTTVLAISPSRERPGRTLPNLASSACRSRAAGQCTYCLFGAVLTAVRQAWDCGRIETPLSSRGSLGLLEVRFRAAVPGAGAVTRSRSGHGLCCAVAWRPPSACCFLAGPVSGRAARSQGRSSGRGADLHLDSGHQPRTPSFVTDR